MKAIYTPIANGIPASFEQVLVTVYGDESEKLPLVRTIPKVHLQGTICIVQDEIPVARCSLYVNPDLLYDGKKTACIGHVECIQDHSVFSTLIETATQKAEEWGMQFLIGPMNGSTWQHHRCHLTHDQALFFTENHQSDYLSELFTTGGFSEISRYYSSIDTEMETDRGKVAEVEARLKERGVLIRSIRLHEFEKELRNMHAFLMESFSHNFLFSPITEDEFVEQYLPYQPYLQEELILIAERHGEVVGLSFCLPDHYDPKKETYIIKTLGMRGDRSLAGLGIVIGNASYREAKKLGYSKCIHAFLREDGSSKKTSSRYAGVPYKFYALYGKPI